jgi:hypothetical protein
MVDNDGCGGKVNALTTENLPPPLHPMDIIVRKTRVKETNDVVIVSFQARTLGVDSKRIPTQK